MRFEYKIIDSESRLTENQLNILGKEGWELVSVMILETMFVYHIKKRIR